ncbi:cytochrome P450 [Apiospora saccharicola]|uniref:Cytochrome P450 n=1 Tax=Apiospora saccharicola TaxID=335842 RepID=A0ABR1U6M1_9PEZI
MIQYAQDLSWGSILTHLGLFLAATLFLVSVRQRYLSPISHIPGPFLASFSRLWHLCQIWSGKQNLRLIEQHDRHGESSHIRSHFVRMAHNEVSVSHPGAVKALLLTTLPKGQWYAIVAFPDYMFYTPFSLLDSKDKNECSNRSRPAMDASMRKLFGWMNKFASEQRPMNLDEFFTFVAFDITGEAVFSKPFGFLDKGEDVNHSIAMNLAAVARIADEIAEAQKQGRCQDGIVSYEDATQLLYLQAAIKEGLRMFAPITMGLPRVAPKRGVTIGDTFFPEGVTLNVSPSIIHTSKEIWGPDAREFNPERWSATDIASREKCFIPWGVGYAACPGQHIARMQLSKITATIVRDYEVRQVVPGAEWKWLAWFTAVPHSWPVYITKRGRPVRHARICGCPSLSMWVP